MRVPHVSVLARLSASIVAVVIILAAFDFSIGHLLERSGIVSDAIDIQSPAALVTKATYTARFQGRRIVLIGDSLVVGEAMALSGNRDWRRHTLSVALEEELSARTPERPVLVMNLGMNGAVPADVEALVGAMLPQKPDVIVLDVSLRSFSLDFAEGAARNSRTWLADGLQLTASGRLPALSGERGFEALVTRLMTNSWRTYQMRDFVRSRWLDGEPRDVVKRLRERLERDNLTNHADTNEMMLLMRVRKRYASSTLDYSNTQFAALMRTIAKMRVAGQHAVIFYAKENPRLLAGLMDEERYATMLHELEEAIVGASGPEITYLGPLADLHAGNYLDHVHVDAQGYGIYARHLAMEIARLQGHQ
ncbi:MAG: hypothetical protein AB7Q97_02920 [Gammaproteobacteria bacterium]